MPTEREKGGNPAEPENERRPLKRMDDVIVLGEREVNGKGRAQQQIKRRNGIRTRV